MLARRLFPGLLILGIGCTDLPVGDDQLVLEMVGEPAASGEMPRGVYVMVPPELEPVAEDLTVFAGEPRLIYMNRKGGVYTPGSNNSSTNRSTIVKQTSQVPAWNVSDANWKKVMDCVTDQFARFNVVVTDVDPGDKVHVESVVAGRPQHVGMQAGVGGVSPFSCGMIERSIVFTFAEVYGTNYQEICHTVAQEVAHSYGLDHQLLCADPMTYLSGCGAKTFQDTDASCGEYQARQCQCGGTKQNSVKLLYQRLGAADTLAPEVTIDQPKNGATVAAGFQVVASATDDVAVTKVELYVDGALVETRTQAPYTFTTDASLAPGSHAIEVVAYDAKSSSSDAITVMLQDSSNPGDPNDPNDPNNPGDPNDPNDPGDGCEANGTCPEYPGGPGDTCTDGGDCLSGLCASSGGDSRCTDLCDPTDPNSCPSGFQCTPTSGDESVCWPNPADPNGDGGDLTGGCSTAAGMGGANLLLLALAGLMTRRRRRPSN